MDTWGLSLARVDPYQAEGGIFGLGGRVINLISEVFWYESRRSGCGREEERDAVRAMVKEAFWEGVWIVEIKEEG